MENKKVVSKLNEGNKSMANNVTQRKNNNSGLPGKVIQRKPGDYAKLVSAVGSDVTVKYKEGPHMKNKNGIVNTVKNTSLYVGDKRFVKNWVEEDDFEISKIALALKRIDPTTVDHDRPLDPFSEDADRQRLSHEDFAEKRELVQVLRDVVELAHTMPSRLRALMPHDREYNMSPEAQLAYCVEISKGYNAGVLAKALYTTYFYNPINKFLRGQLPRDFHYKIRKLIIHTLITLQRDLKKYPVARDIDTLRVEAQAEWIGDKGVGQSIRFPALTSLHKEKASMESMLSDLGNGTFGPVSKVAILNIKGRTPIIEPVVKYYPNEREIIVPPGMTARIVAVKDLTLDIPNIGRKPARLYTLEIVNPHARRVAAPVVASAGVDTSSSPSAPMEDGERKE